MTARAPGTPRSLRPGDGTSQRGLLGALLLLLAGLVGPAGWHLPGERPDTNGSSRERAAGVGRPQGDPLADLLAPLGPVKAVLSSVLWVAFADEIRAGGSDDVPALAEGLLALHPGLDRVRVHLAEELVVNEAARAPDDRRHAALVQAGLAMLEEGLERHDSPDLHGALGRLVLERAWADPRFVKVAEAYFGVPVDEVAIGELRSAIRVDDPRPIDLVLLADQLVARGLHSLERASDTWSAGRDLREAEVVLGAVEHEGVTSLVHKLEELRARWERASAEELGNS